MNPADYKVPADDLIEESVRLLPDGWDFPDGAGFRAHLRERLPQSAESTRKNAAETITRRFYDNDRLNRPLVALLRLAPSQAEKRDLVAYVYLCAEPMAGRLVREAIYPRLCAAEPQITADEIHEYVSGKLGRASEKAVIRLARALMKFGHLARPSSKGQPYRIRGLQPWFPAVLFALHTELRIPAMYLMQDIEDSEFRRLFLLTGDALQTFLKKAEEEGVISRVRAAGLDQVRTTMTLSELTSRLTGLAVDDLE